MNDVPLSYVPHNIEAVREEDEVRIQVGQLSNKSRLNALEYGQSAYKLNIILVREISPRTALRS